MGYDLGVDLGTTFVAAAVARPEQIEMFTLGDRSVVAPSVVYRRDDGELVPRDRGRVGTAEQRILDRVCHPVRDSRLVHGQDNRPGHHGRLQEPARVRPDEHVQLAGLRRLDAEEHEGRSSI